MVPHLIPQQSLLTSRFKKTILQHSFKLTNRLGLERRNEQLTARAWIFGNYSLGIAQLEKNNKSSIFKFGLDLFRDVAELESVKLAALAFVYREMTSIERESREEIAGSTLRYNALLAGVGAVISW